MLDEYNGKTHIAFESVSQLFGLQRLAREVRVTLGVRWRSHIVRHVDNSTTIALSSSAPTNDEGTSIYVIAPKKNGLAVDQRTNFPIVIEVKYEKPFDWLRAKVVERLFSQSDSLDVLVWSIVSPCG